MHESGHINKFSAPKTSESEYPTEPIHVDFKTVYLGGIFLIMLLVIIHEANEILIPIVLAFLLKLAFQPVVRKLHNLGLPQAVVASLIIIVLISSVNILGNALSTPASNLIEKIPEGFNKVRAQIKAVSRSVEKTQKILTQAEDLTKTGAPKVTSVAIAGTALSDKVFTGTKSFILGLLTTLIILFFLLISGDTFLRRLVEILPRFKDKRQAVDISQHIEHDISRYLFTITIMNLFVGVMTGIIMWLCNIEDPLLWGTIAFLFNFAPILGPIVCVVIFVLVGLVSSTSALPVLVPALLYLLAHFTESMIITPLLLARRFTLNPVLVILSLVFWYWIWGFVGAVLAVPMLAIFKIICDHIHTLNPVGHFIEG